MRPVRPHGCNQRARAGVSVTRSAITSSTMLAASPLSSATRSRSAGANAISPRMARSVIAATWVFKPGIVGELVDAFLADHGGIHVGEKKPLAPVGFALHHHVERAVVEGGPHAIGNARVSAVAPGSKGMSAASPGFSQRGCRRG